MEKCPTAEEILGLDEPLPPNIDTVQFKLMLDFSIAVFVRLEELGLKQKDLAELLNVSPAAVSKMLSPIGNISLRTMAKVAVALGCEFDDLRMHGVSDTAYVPISDLELLTTLMTEDDPYGLMIDEDLGTIFYISDILSTEDLTDETGSVEYAFIDLSEEAKQQIEVCAVPPNKERKRVQEQTTRKVLAA